MFPVVDLCTFHEPLGQEPHKATGREFVCKLYLFFVWELLHVISVLRRFSGFVVL